MSYVQFHVKRPGADVLVTLQIVIEGKGKRKRYILGLRSIQGKIKLGPKAMRAAIIEELTKIENVAREAGFHEMRHSGDDRAAFLPGYEPFPELPNGRRKRL